MHSVLTQGHHFESLLSLGCWKSFDVKSMAGFKGRLLADCWYIAGEQDRTEESNTMQIMSRVACVCPLFRCSITDHKEFLVLDMCLLPQRVPGACTDKGGNKKCLN